MATPITTPKQIYVPKGSIKKIITKLQAHIPLSDIDAYVLSLIGTPQYGWIDLKGQKIARADFLHRLTTSKAALVKVKMIPGETTYMFLRSAARKFGYDGKVLQKEYELKAPYPEGVFFADTYHIPKGLNEKEFIDIVLDLSMRRHKELAEKFYGNFNPKIWFEKTVTVASIIQKEAANKEEMPLVSAVIYNRLKKRMPLQMDGTLNYGRFSHTKITSKRIKEDSSPFNTYKHPGLPPYPVSIVGMEAIKAAVKPAKADYLYFVKVGRNRHKFSKSYKEHLKAIKSVKKRNKKSN